MHKLIYPAGDGRINYITRNDIARGVIAIIKIQILGANVIYYQATVMIRKELAAILSEASGTEIKYEPVSLETFAEMYDEPKGFGAYWHQCTTQNKRTIRPRIQ